jgi:hypothetical protein
MKRIMLLYMMGVLRVIDTEVDFTPFIAGVAGTAVLGVAAPVVGAALDEKSMFVMEIPAFAA